MQTAKSSASTEPTSPSINTSESNVTVTPFVTTRYPHDAEYAFMAKFVYQDQEKQNSDRPFAECETQDERIFLAGWLQHWRQQGWEIVGNELGFFEESLTGYVGSAYVNHRTRQVVVAHRGTKITYGALREDVKAIFLGQLGRQHESALHYYKLVKDNFTGQGENNKISHELNSYQISFTGHSLGAWLAEMCAADALMDDWIIHTVSFDSPGSYEAIEKHAANKRVDHFHQLLVQLDVKNYLASPNFINVCNHHVGTMIELEVAEAPSQWITYTYTKHKMTGLLKAFDKETGYVLRNKSVKRVKQWPHWNWGNRAGAQYPAYHRPQTYHYSIFSCCTAEAVMDPDFKTRYEEHYDVEQMNFTYYALRHLHPKVSMFLQSALKVREGLLPYIEDEILKQCLSIYTLISLPPTRETYLHLPIAEGTLLTAYEFSQTLMSYLHHNASLFERIKTLRNPHSLIANLGDRVIALEDKESEARAEEKPLATIIGARAQLKDASMKDIHQDVVMMDQYTTPEQLAFVASEFSQMGAEKKRLEIVGPGANLSNVNISNVSQSLFNFSGTAQQSRHAIATSLPTEGDDSFTSVSPQKKN